MQPSSTAPKGRSIWDSVGRKTFEHNVNALKNMDVVPQSRAVYTIADRQSSELTKGHISIEVERELADDFAFIAAWEEGVRTVTATTIEATSSGMKVVLAANEGIDENVESAFASMFRSLEACAHCGLFLCSCFLPVATDEQSELSRTACANELLQTVVHLNLNRIRGRLGSRKFVSPFHRQGQIQTTLPSQIRTLVKTSTVSKKSAEWSQFHTEVVQLQQKFEEMEGLDPSEDSNSIVVLLEHTYLMTIDGISLPRRLQQLGFQRGIIDCKQFRQLMKLSNYARICQALAEKARSLRSLFRHLEIQKLEPFTPVICDGAKRFIHAEVQIIIHYTMSQPERTPRVVGASKEACFLCDSFVRAHGQFQLSRAHRQLYHLWSVPDLKEYSDASLDHLRKCLQAVNRDLTQTRSKVQHAIRRNPFPIQSSINLVKAVIPTASMSTIRSTHETIDALAWATSPWVGHELSYRLIKDDVNLSENRSIMSSSQALNEELHDKTLIGSARLPETNPSTEKFRHTAISTPRSELGDLNRTSDTIETTQRKKHSPHSDHHDQSLLSEHPQTQISNGQALLGSPEHHVSTMKVISSQTRPKIKKRRKRKKDQIYSKRRKPHGQHRRQKTTSQEIRNIGKRPRRTKRTGRRKWTVSEVWKKISTACKHALSWLLDCHRMAS